MTTVTPPNRHLRRPQPIAIVAIVLGVVLVVATAAWGASRNPSTPTPPGTAGTAATPAATTAGPSTPTASRPASPKAKAKAKVKAKTNGGAPTNVTPKKAAAKTSAALASALKKLPAGVVEPGRKLAAPVDVKKTSVADSVRVDLTGFKSVKSKASGLGEISGPAVRLTIRLTNTGSKRLSLTSVVVNAYYGKAGTPGILITGDPASKPFTGSLKAGAKASAVFVFNMPVSKRGDATITVSPSPTLPIAVFAGSVD